MTQVYSSGLYEFMRDAHNIMYTFCVLEVYSGKIRRLWLVIHTLTYFYYFNSHPLEIVSRSRDPQNQVGDN